MKYILPRDCRCRSCVLSPSGWTQSGARQQQCLRGPQPAKALKGLRTQLHVSGHIWMPSRFYAQRLSVWLWWTPSSKADRGCQKRLTHTPGGNSLVAASRRWGTRLASPGTHCQQTQNMCGEARAMPHQGKQMTIRDQQNPEPAQEQ